MRRHMPDRRTTVRSLLALGCLIPLLRSHADAESARRPIRFGICADVHKDVMHDADQRLKVFVDRMNQQKVDFIVQLGDFCRPYDRNNGFMSVWNSFDGPGYHVLGNHDMDGGFTREQTVAYWQIPAKYYAFDRGGFHFIVLDGNDKTDPPQSGYARYIGEGQQQWLRKELASTRLPTVIFSHQSLEDEGGVANGEAIRKILEEANQAGDGARVMACFSGHHHIDYSREINGIQYIQINSMSYFWVGGDYQRIRYSPEIDRDYPWVKYTIPYKDPLFALVTLEADGTIRIEGRKSEWVGPSPWDLGYPKDKRDRIVPRIATRRLRTVVR